MGAGVAGGSGPGQHRFHLQGGVAVDGTAAVERLGAIGAVFFAAAGADAEQGGELDVIAGVGGPVDLLGLPEQVHQGGGQQGFDLRLGPVVARDHGGV
jgi:hypothetical protein